MADSAVVFTRESMDQASDSMLEIQKGIVAVKDTLETETSSLDSAFICDEDNAGQRLKALLEKVTTDVGTIGENVGTISTDILTVKQMAIDTEEAVRDLTKV